MSMEEPMPSYFEAVAETPFEPGALLASCVESGAAALLLDDGTMPADFFDLSSGLAGELLHKFTTYRIRIAGVVPDLSIHSERFQQFANEANGTNDYRFFATRREAIDWLEPAD